MRNSRLFGHARPKSLATTAPSPSPGRTLVFTSPQMSSPEDLTTFTEFDFGFDKLADSLNFPDPFAEPSPYKSSRSARFAVHPVLEEEDEESCYDSDSDAGSYVAVSVSVSSPGKPRLVDIRMHRTNSSMTHSSKSSSDTTSRTLYSLASHRSKGSTAASSITDLSGQSPRSLTFPRDHDFHNTSSRMTTDKADLRGRFSAHERSWFSNELFQPHPSTSTPPHVLVPKRKSSIARLLKY